MKVIRIISTVDGFRRAGIAHPAQARDYPVGRITDKQFAILRAEPKLVVQILDLPDDAPPLELEEADDTHVSPAPPAAPEPKPEPGAPGQETSGDAPAEGEPAKDKDAKAGKAKAEGK